MNLRTPPPPRTTLAVQSANTHNHHYHHPLQCCLLENLRFHQGEVEDDPGFAQQLAALADVYVNDAFAVCHRQQASVTVGVDAQPSTAVTGLLAA